jgi:hypothetical protein
MSGGQIILPPGVEAKIDTTNARLGDTGAPAAGSVNARLEQIRALLAATLAVSGSVALDAASLAALETIGLDAATLSALENIGADTELPAPVALADNLSNPTVPQVGAHMLVWDGTQHRRMVGSGAGIKAVISDGAFGVEKGTATFPITISGTPIATAAYKKYVSGELTLATATGVQDLLTLWHPSASSVTVYVLAVNVYFRVLQTAGSLGFEGQFITAENGTPGGTTVNSQTLNRSGGAGALTARSQVTGAPTTTGNLILKRPFPLPAAAAPRPSEFPLVDTRSLADIPQLRGGQAEGLRLSANVAATLTTAPVCVIEVLTYEA